MPYNRVYLHMSLIYAFFDTDSCLMHLHRCAMPYINAFLNTYFDQIYIININKFKGHIATQQEKFHNADLRRSFIKMANTPFLLD